MFGGVETLSATPAVAAVATNGTVYPVERGTSGTWAPPPPSRDRALWEKEVLGFQFGDHPFMEAAGWLANQLTHDTSQLTTDLSGERVKIAGLVTGVRRVMTKTKC